MGDTFDSQVIDKNTGGAYSLMSRAVRREITREEAQKQYSAGEAPFSYAIFNIGETMGWETAGQALASVLNQAGEESKGRWMLGNGCI